MCFIHSNARAVETRPASSSAGDPVGLCPDCVSDYDRCHAPKPIREPLICAVLALLDASDAHVGFRQHAANIRKQYAGVIGLAGWKAES
jgi:hypothetical protein